MMPKPTVPKPTGPPPQATLFVSPGKVGLRIAGGTMQMNPDQARVLAENLIELAFLAGQMEDRPAEAARQVESPGYPTNLRRPPALIQ